jgi:hypothetical protein
MPISDSWAKLVERSSLDMFGKLLDLLHWRVPPTEREVAFLLRLFGYSPARTEDERQERIDDTITSDDSLKWAALHYGKDPRTIRAWCEKGFFPSAYRTPGRHWRIPFRAIREAENRLDAFARAPKTLRGSKEWAQLRQRLKNIPKGVRAACEVYAAVQDLATTEFRAKRVKVSVGAVDGMLLAHETGILPWLRLRLAARRLLAGEPTKRITRQMLARELGMSVAGLYRQYGADPIRRAIRQASRPLKSDDVGAETLSNLSEVASMFSEYEGFDDRGQKVDVVSGQVTEVGRPKPKGKRTTD